MKKSSIIFLCCLAFVLGVAIYSFFFKNRLFFDPFYLYLVFIFLFVLAFGDFVFSKSRRSLASLLPLAFFILGLCRFALAMPVQDSSQLSFYNNQTLIMRGVITEEPDQKQASRQYTLGHLALVNGLTGALSKSIQGRLLLVNKSFPEFSYGDQLEFTCLLEKPENFNDFDYGSYLARYDIYEICRFPKEIKISNIEQASRVQAALYKIKNKFAASINHLLPEPQASFLAGLLYGARQNIPEEIKNAFKRTSTSHIVAVSGYNISIVAGFIVNLLAWFWLPRRAAFYFSVLAIIAFVILTGAGASVVRAGLMGLLVLLAKNTGRLSKVRNVLAVTACLMLWQNPKILAFDVGFQLSFASTIGLVAFSSYFQEKLKFLSGWFDLPGILGTTLSAILLTAPLLMYQFGTFSFISPLANLLILPFIPLTMGLGFMAGFLGIIAQPLGQVAGWLVWLPLTYEIKTAQTLALFPIGEIKIPVFIFCLLYAIIFAFWFKVVRRWEKEKKVAITF